MRTVVPMVCLIFCTAQETCVAFWRVGGQGLRLLPRQNHALTLPLLRALLARFKPAFTKEGISSMDPRSLPEWEGKVSAADSGTILTRRSTAEPFPKRRCYEHLWHRSLVR